MKDKIDISNANIIDHVMCDAYLQFMKLKYLHGGSKMIKYDIKTSYSIIGFIIIIDVGQE